MVFVFLICPQNTLLVAFIEKDTRKYDHQLKELPNSFTYAQYWQLLPAKLSFSS